MRLKKYLSPTYFLFVAFMACTPKIYQKIKSEEKNISLDKAVVDDHLFEAVINPYKQKLDGDMNRVLAYTRVELDKKGFENLMFNVMADLTLERGNEEYQKIAHQAVDFCLLNKGGLRTTIAQGNIRTKDVFEVMPFENEVVIVEISGKKTKELLDYLAKSEFGHPISGLRIEVVKHLIKTATIQGKPFDENKNYTIITSDYLQKGGDNMGFFTNPLKLTNLKLKARDMMIQYFDKIDTVHVKLDQRFSHD